MRPLAVLLGIVMGSTVSIAVALALTLIVFLAMPDQSDRLAAEFAPLARSVSGSLALAIVASLSFYGELRLRSWRLVAHTLLAAAMLAVAWLLWPRGWIS